MPRNDFINIDGTINYDNIASTSQVNPLSLLINAKYPPAPLVACKADGVTDDISAAKAIVDYAHTNNVVAFFPSGTYKFTNSLNIIGKTQIECATGCFFDFSSSPNDGVVLLPGYHTGRMIFGTISGASNGAGLRVYGAALAYIWFNLITACKDGILIEADSINGYPQDNTLEGMMVSYSTNGIRVRGETTLNVIQGNLFRINFLAGNVNSIIFDAPANVTPGWAGNLFDIPAIDAFNVVNSKGITSTSNTQVNGQVFMHKLYYSGFASKYFDLSVCNGNHFEIAVYGSIAPANITLKGVSNYIVDVTINTNPPLSQLAIPASTSSNTQSTWNSGNLIQARRTHISLNIATGGLSAGSTADFYVYHAFVTGQSNNVCAYPRWSAPMVVIAIEDESTTAGVDGIWGIPFQIHIRVLAVAAVLAGTYNVDVECEG